MAQQTAQQKAEQGSADTGISQEEAQSKPGDLSPAAAAQLAADNDNIARTYSTQRATVARTIGARGFGSAPSGFMSTAENGANLAQDQAGTEAYRAAQLNTEQQRQAAIAARTALSGQNQAGASSASQEGSDSAYKQSQMGSTAGDVLGAVASLAPIAAAPFTGGATLIPGGFNRIGGNAPSSGVGGYGGKCYVAAELYGGWNSPITILLRSWIFSTRWMRPFATVYTWLGPQWARLIQRNRVARKLTRRLFDAFLIRAVRVGI
jgi:hypothetical protein